MDFAFHAPLNSLSLGQTSINILRELYKNKYEPCIFPIGEINLNAFTQDVDFNSWIEKGINKSYTSHNRENPTLKIWHIGQSIESFSKKQVLFTFHETDRVTPVEKNIVDNNSKVLFSSKYSKDIFESFGCKNVGNVALGFDNLSFYPKEKDYNNKDKICFGLAGKLEKRKQHFKILNLWAKKYGNDSRYFLNCALFNHHIQPELQQNLIGQALEGKRYFNINFLPFLEQNTSYNDYLNSNHAMIDLSSAEGWSLPSFQSTCLGKHLLALNATGIKDWVNEDNSVLINPSGKISLHDGLFFHKSSPYNQGEGFDFSDKDFYNGINLLIERIKKNPLNEDGLKLQKKFTWSSTADTLIKELEKI